jgi:zinc transport system permease protein
MSEFFRALCDPDLLFLRYALLAGLAGSIAFGVMGSYVVVRRISYVAGAISHCVLGGIGLGLFLQVRMGWSWCDPILTALASVVVAALIIGVASLRARQREDSIIGAVWAIGMAIGLLFLAKTPGYVDPMSYLFGNILLTTRTNLIIVCVLDATILILVAMFYNSFLAICYDEEFARLRGIRVESLYLLLLCLIAATIVLMIQVVGIVMVIALLTLPAAAASILSRRLWQMMILASVFCAFSVVTGLAISYSPNLPSGPTIIIVAAILYIVVLVGKMLSGKRNARRKSQE